MEFRNSLLVSENMDWEAIDLNFAGKDKAIILSETMTRDEIYKLFLTTIKERQRLAAEPVALKRRVVNLLRNPWRIPGGFSRRFKAIVLHR